ncbi:4Fe-4S binding protein, partial [Methanoregula sp.]|uniref:4Fe-4S binding protein n=1 Tax=Methanoregula sp. TaxID=2052170 RepID=UPI0025D7441B
MTEKQAQKNPVSSRQTIRKWILIVSFLLIPVTIFYISPIILMMGAAEGIATGSMILLILLFVLSFFVARLWCGWLCPMGAWQEICSPVFKHTVQEGWRKYVKYGIAALWLGALALTIVTAGGIRSVDPFYGTVNGISISSPDVLVIVAVIFAVIFITAFLAGRRGFCGVLCPMAIVMIAGRKIGNIVKLPALRLAAYPSRCIDCGNCSMTCPMSPAVMGVVHNGVQEMGSV